MLGCRWGLTEFADLCFSDTRHSRIFTTECVITMIVYDNGTHILNHAVLSKRVLVL